MNSLNKSILSFMKKDCIAAFGNKKGLKIFSDTSFMLKDLISVCPFSQEKNRKLTKYWILAD
jgi:hypothetical protein